MESIRIDLWIKMACLVRHRSDATDACRGGLVKINGRRAKPSALVRVGDEVELQKERTLNLVVLEIPQRQVARQQARELYRDESPPPPVRTDAAIGIETISGRERGAGRPTKKDRREIERLRKQGL